MPTISTDPIYNPTIYAGGKWVCTIKFTNDDDTPQDLTGYSFYMDFVASPGGRKYVSPTIVVTPLTGTVELTLLPADSLKLANLSVYYDLLQVLDSDPDNDRSVRLRGTPTIVPVVTEVP